MRSNGGKPRFGRRRIFDNREGRRAARGRNVLAVLVSCLLCMQMLSAGGNSVFAMAGEAHEVQAIQDAASDIDAPLGSGGRPEEGEIGASDGGTTPSVEADEESLGSSGEATDWTSRLDCLKLSASLDFETAGGGSVFSAGLLTLGR